jgi:hypothetical protein
MDQSSAESPEKIYLIGQGVHRCVAARVLGLKSIRARIYDDGRLSEECEIRLEQLRSSKAFIDRWHKRRDFLELVARMATESGRTSVGAIEVSTLDDQRAQYFTRIEAISIVTDREE